MAISKYFYHGIMRKYVAVFGTLFNGMTIRRVDESGQKLQHFTVPIAYGPWPKYLAVDKEDPDQKRNRRIQLPRMSFEMDGFEYDAERSIGASQLVECSEDGVTKVSKAVPYNVTFNLYIMVKYAEDGAKIVEQIVPHFNPVFNSRVRLVQDMQPVDIPISLNSVTLQDTYEQDMTTRRVIIWTLSFTLQGWFFGAATGPNHGDWDDDEEWTGNGLGGKPIKFVDIKFFTGTNSTPYAEVTAQPGLTEDGEPTYDPEESIPWRDIEATDDWAPIVTIKSEIGDRPDE